jgi:hypothetical protein
MPIMLFRFPSHLGANRFTDFNPPFTEKELPNAFLPLSVDLTNRSFGENHTL